jgi:hypothetical protein
MIIIFDIFILLLMATYYSLFFSSSIRDLKALEELYIYSQFLVIDPSTLKDNQLDILIGNLLMIDFSRFFMLTIKVSKGIDMWRQDFRRKDVNSFFMISFAYYA